MKIFFGCGWVSSLCLFSVATFAAADTKVDSQPLNLAGTYKCTGYDRHDGSFMGEIIITLDKEASNIEHNQYAYKFTASADITDAYSSSGIVAAQGDLVGFYFENDDKKGLATDYGVGVGTVSHIQDNKGQYTTQISLFYYEPEYNREAKAGKTAGGNGTETCIKVK